MYILTIPDLVVIIVLKSVCLIVWIRFFMLLLFSCYLYIYYPHDIVFTLWWCVWHDDMTRRHDDMTWHNDTCMTDWHDKMTCDWWGGVGAEVIREILD